MASRLIMVATVGLLLAACGSAPSRPPAPAPDTGGAVAPGAPLEIRARAEAAYAGGRYAEAATWYAELVKQIPAEGEYWYRLGNALVRSGRLEDAAFAYQRTLIIDESHGRAWHNLGVVRMRQAQEAFAEGIKTSDSTERVFQDSLRLSTGLYSLMEHGRSDADAPAPSGQESP